MSSVLIDIDVVDNILTSYHRAIKNQTRVYGIIFGTKNKTEYKVTNAIYGYIFEEIDPSNGSISFNRLNNESMNTLLNSISTNYPNEVILGGFATDTELFPQLDKLYSTIELIPSKNFPNLNELILLVDPNYKNDKQTSNIKYGVKMYKWEKNYLVSKNNEDLSEMLFQEINYEISKELQGQTLMHSRATDIWRVDNAVDKLEDTPSNLDNLIQSLSQMESDFDKKIEADFDNCENTAYIKTQLMLVVKYLELVEKYVNKIMGEIDSYDENKKMVIFELLNKIEFAINMTQPLLTKGEIIETMKKDSERNKIVSALVGLLNIQVQLTETINKH